MKKKLPTLLTNLQIIILVSFSIFAAFIIAEISNTNSKSIGYAITFASFYFSILLYYDQVLRLNEKPKNLFIDYIDSISILVTIWIFSYIITETWSDFVDKSEPFMIIYFLALLYFIILIIRKIIKIFKHIIYLSKLDR